MLNHTYTYPKAKLIRMTSFISHLVLILSPEFFPKHKCLDKNCIICLCFNVNLPIVLEINHYKTVNSNTVSNFAIKVCTSSLSYIFVFWVNFFNSESGIFGVLSTCTCIHVEIFD